MAVEVDGSAHFTQNEPFVPLGRTLWRWRLLASRGWRVRGQRRRQLSPRARLRRARCRQPAAGLRCGCTRAPGLAAFASWLPRTPSYRLPCTRAHTPPHHP